MVVAVTPVIWAGMGSVTTAFVASLGPWLVAVMVEPDRPAGDRLHRRHRLDQSKVGCGGNRDVSLASLLDGSPSSPPDTEAVLVIDGGAELATLTTRRDIWIARPRGECVAAGAGNSLGGDAAAPAGARGAGDRSDAGTVSVTVTRPWVGLLPVLDTDSVNPEEPPHRIPGVGLGHHQVGGGHRGQGLRAGIAQSEGGVGLGLVGVACGVSDQRLVGGRRVDGDLELHLVRLQARSDRR